MIISEIMGQGIERVNGKATSVCLDGMYAHGRLSRSFRIVIPKDHKFITDLISNLEELQR